MHLHNHSVYSVIDGRGKIEDYLKLAKLDGQEAFALTDHGSLGGAIELYKQAKEIGIKPIIGMELYVDVTELREKNFPGHLTVLARNEDGYRALIAANNLAHRQYYYRPRVTLQQLIQGEFSRHWYILSGCMSSPLYDLVFNDSLEVIKQLNQHSAGFFLELMWHGSQDEQYNYKQDEYLEKMAAFHKATNLPMVITNDCHYAYSYQEEIHKQLLAQSQEPEGLEFDGTGFYLKTHQEMQFIADNLGVPNAVDNAVEISKSCQVVIPEADKINWHVPDITGGRPYERIRELAEPKLANYPPEYRERYQYELSVLSTSPAILNSYLVAHDVVEWCGRQGITIAARGSMAGSLVSFLLGITLEDPVKYRLSFARAVNPARPTIPDFDLDVSSQHRAAILDYLKERYNGNIPIAAYSHYGPKGALRKVLRMEGLREFKEINELTRPLPDDWADGDFEYSESSHRYIGKAPWFENIPEQYRNFVAIYQGLYGSLSAHPSGILISGPEREIEKEIPLQWIASSKQLVSAYDMYTLKKMGLFKLDVLGLRTLDQLAYMEAVSHAKVPDDNYDDPTVLAAFGADLLAEIFQMDGYACREVIRQIFGIRNFEDIIAANTLARPGSAQFTPFYRSGLTSLVAEYPQIEEVLGYTNGLILYQEQVMEICRILADFNDGEQDDVKEAIKYFQHETFKEISDKFRERCAAKGIESTNILKAIEDMSSYTYNRAHAMTYAAIAYKMMWYKVYHPAVYYAAVYDGAEDKQRLVLESYFFKVKWHPADINYSEPETTVKNGEIYLGLSAIKGVGPAACAAILAARPFTDIIDFSNRISRRKCNVRVQAKLQDAFACTSIGIKGKLSDFQENFGFNYRFLDYELVQKIQGYEGNNRVAGFVTEYKAFKIAKDGRNKGKEMCHVYLTNAKGRHKCVLFPDIWEKARGKIYSGLAIIFDGQFETNGQFIVEGGSEL